MLSVNEFPFPPVLTKRDGVARYKAGEFGNASPTYNNRWELNNQGSCARKYHLRNKVTGGETFYNLDFFECFHLWAKAPDPDQWYCSEMAPHDQGTIQGEVMQGPEGIELFYATAKIPMRDALRLEGQRVQGMLALGLLKTYLCPRSYDWMMVLLERYPSHVIEFTSFTCEWGTLAGYNTIIWEIRNY